MVTARVYLHGAIGRDLRLRLSRFIQIGPLRVLFRRKRRGYPAAVGRRQPESRKQARELPCLGSRDSSGPKLRHCTDNVPSESPSQHAAILEVARFVNPLSSRKSLLAFVLPFRVAHFPWPTPLT